MEKMHKSTPVQDKIMESLLCYQEHTATEVRSLNLPCLSKKKKGRRRRLNLPQ